MAIRKVNLYKAIAAGLLAAALVTAGLYWDLAELLSPARIQEWLQKAGSWAPLAYMATMALAVVISPIPSVPLDVAAGAFFGPWLGTLYSALGALGGSLIAFGIARLLGRGLIERLLSSHIDFCTACSNRLLSRVVFISRLAPVVSFDLVSYGAGLTKMSAGSFGLATFVGMLPLTFVYNYFGSVLVMDARLGLLLGGTVVVMFFALPRLIEKRNFLGLRRFFPHLVHTSPPDQSATPDSRGAQQTSGGRER